MESLRPRLQVETASAGPQLRVDPLRVAQELRQLLAAGQQLRELVRGYPEPAYGRGRYGHTHLLDHLIRWYSRGFLHQLVHPIGRRPVVT